MNRSPSPLTHPSRSLLQTSRSKISRVRPTKTCAIAAPLPQRATPDAPISRRVAIFVEPSPFSHVCGYQNRFLNLIRNLRESQDQVTVVTPCTAPPEEFHGARVVNVLGFPLPFYATPTLLLSLGLSVRVVWELIRLNPDIIHVSFPSVIVGAAAMYAKVMRKALVISYHTHIPDYIPRYTFPQLVNPMWSVIRWANRVADLTLVTSQAMKQELSKNMCRTGRIEVWRRGVDVDVFNPKWRCDTMRARLFGADAVQEASAAGPLLLYVGRLGAEKNIQLLAGVLDRLPAARLALVGDGPQRKELEALFSKYGGRVVFTGLLRGRDLSAAYASADIFVMPSESETLGFVVMEAMASGLPVVAAAAGGLVDLITPTEGDGRVGLLFTPGDADHAAAQVARLVSDKDLASRIITAARTETELHGWRAATDHLRGLQYAMALKRKRAKLRFWVLRLRTFAMWCLRGLWQAAVFAVRWMVYQLDYARDYRGDGYSKPTMQPITGPLQPAVAMMSTSY